MPKAAQKTSPKKTKGHWPAGKRRNEDVGGKWSRTRLAVGNLIAEHWERGRISNQALALAMGVNKTTVARWLDGTDRPNAETQTAVAEWLKEHKPKKTV